MEDLTSKLVEAYVQLGQLKCQSTSKFDDACQIKDLTYTQIEYLKIINQMEYVTISELAEKTMNSKPTVTEMVKKFIQLDCLYKQQCAQDGRKQYLFLSERGKKIAQMDQYVMYDVVQQLMKNLTHEEVKDLISLLNKGTKNI